MCVCVCVCVCVGGGGGIPVMAKTGRLRAGRDLTR